MPKKSFVPRTYSKSTIYIGAGPTGEALVKKISQDMRRLKKDFSPLLIHSFEIFHELDHGIEEEATQRGITAAELINLAYRAYAKSLTSLKGVQP